jgi:hypothetical protein
MTARRRAIDALIKLPPPGSELRNLLVENDAETMD